MLATDNALLRSLGIPIPPGTNEDEAVKKILHDSYVQTKVIDLMVKRYAAEAIAALLPVEREALGKRAGINPLPQKAAVSWGVIYPDASTSGKLMIQATCGAESILWNGGAQSLRSLRFRGEAVPADIAAIYTMHYGDGNDPELLAAQRDFNSLEEAKRKQFAADESAKKATRF